MNELITVQAECYRLQKEVNRLNEILTLIVQNSGINNVQELIERSKLMAKEEDPAPAEKETRKKGEKQNAS